MNFIVRKQRTQLCGGISKHLSAKQGHE